MNGLRLSRQLMLLCGMLLASGLFFTYWHMGGVASFVQPAAQGVYSKVQNHQSAKAVSRLDTAQRPASLDPPWPAADIPMARATHAAGQSSSFTCTGVKWNEENAASCPYCRTCRFNNMCLNHSSLLIQYYLEDENMPLFFNFLGMPFFHFPPDFINTGHVHIPPSKVDWAPTVVTGTIPNGSNFHKAPVVAYASSNDFVFNFGHALFDFLFPVFNMLYIMGAYDPEFQLLLADHQGGDPKAGDAFIFPAQAHRSLLALISHHPVLTRQQIKHQADQASSTDNGLTCFRSLVAGTGSFQATKQRVRALPFRSAAFANLGLPSMFDAGDIPMITMITKKGRRIVENANEVMSHLQTKFTMADFQVLSGDMLAEMPIREQLKIMSQTSILITPCGGTGTVLAFLQPGSTAIVFNYWLTVKTTSIQMESLYYWNLEHVNFEYVPVLPEDYEETTDRPGCELSTADEAYEQLGSLVHCNIRLKNLARLEHIVQNAVHLWQNSRTTS